MDREFSAVEASTEDIYKLTIDIDPASWVSLRTTWRMQERRADDYDAHYLEESFPNGEPYEAAFNEGMRRYYWTDRDRDSIAVQFDVTPAARWSIYGEVSAYDDDYFDPETGLPIGSSFTVQEDRNFDTVPEPYTILLAGRTQNQALAQSLGVAYSTGPRFDVYADYTHEEFQYALASRYRNVSGGVGTDDPLDDWTSHADDDYDTASLGFHWSISGDRRWALQGDLSRSDGTSLIHTDFVPGGSPSGDTSLTVFPEVEAKLSLATLTLNRVASKNLDYSLRYWYESWHEDNFASDFNEPYMGEPSSDPSMANAIFLGIDFKNYTNHILSFLVRYRY
jgi:putative beta-barrel porin MtrB/PioB